MKSFYIYDILFDVKLTHINKRFNMKTIEEIFRDESGATAIEYGLIAALISIAAITAFSTVGTKLSALMLNTSNKLH